MTAVFFASLTCHHPLLSCWLVLTTAGPIHVSFLPGAHQHGMAELLTGRLLPPGATTPYRLVATNHPAIKAGAEQTRAELLAYLNGERREFTPLPPSPFMRAGTLWQQKVWRQLSKIPYGETRTYGEIGAELGSRRLARAVGSACGANPCPLLIPCHRVVASTGPGGFSGGGLAVKKSLLALERDNSKRARR
ncbi:methylated-DNA--[protein]-cysteine S-methyltransferase [Desulfurivibrio dismutans]|uniref:methylated-DNA--[protein]-cysteine S-methyltransferase n=1 Tax=Desulfurivibrio dismutans TaxID=1398908 RepID=UPI0023DC2ABA|nr:methylated-DNA--[protein]-cysteine S-methyltransferase [Desulfurivibrio alkaliphilus]MDF1615167.1 methylated-DNA--[protein]-cysteine S-methyltransferase [Desulfurivibrio alkaliphilus]